MKERPTLTSEHLRWRLRERKTTEFLLDMFIESLPKEKQKAAAERIRNSKQYPA